MKKATLSVSLEYEPATSEPMLVYEMTLDDKTTKGVIKISPQSYADASSLMMHLVYTLLASVSEQPNINESEPDTKSEPNGPSVS